MCTVTLGKYPTSINGGIIPGSSYSHLTRVIWMNCFFFSLLCSLFFNLLRFYSMQILHVCLLFIVVLVQMRKGWRRSGTRKTVNFKYLLLPLALNILAGVIVIDQFLFMVVIDIFRIVQSEHCSYWLPWTYKCYWITCIEVSHYVLFYCSWCCSIILLLAFA